MAQQKQRKKPILTDGKNIFTYCFTTNTKFVLLQLRRRKFWSIHIQISTNFKKIHIQPISYISSITNLYISSIPKNLYVAWWTISYISSIPTWILYLMSIVNMNYTKS